MINKGHRNSLIPKLEKTLEKLPPIRCTLYVQFTIFIGFVDYKRVQNRYKNFDNL